MKTKILLLLAIGLLNINLVTCQNQWVSQTSGTSSFINSVYFVSADTGFVCSDGGNVLKTINGGTNWNQVGAGPWHSLCFLNAQKGFGAFDTDLYITQNGGVNWTSCYSNPNVWGINNICFPGKKQGYATGYSLDFGGYVLKTFNTGVSWDTIYRYTHSLIPFLSMFFKDSLSGFVGCDDGYILKTSNGGNTWIPIPVDIITPVSFYSIYFPTPDTGFAATDIHGVYRTIDGGSTWSHLSMTFPPALYSIWFTDANHGFVGGGNGFGSMTLYQTNNGGNTWTQSLSGAQTLNAIFFVDSLPGYAVGSNGTILKYTQIVGIDENFPSEANINIFPNPTTYTLYIDGLINTATAEIYNINGKLLLSKQLNENQLDITSLAKGLYIIKLSTEEGSVVRKFVKE